MGEKITLINVQKGLKYYRQTVIEEHISMIEEPGSKYIGHVAPASGSAKDIKGSIVNFLEKNDFSFADLVAVGCDGTNVNTGRIGGAIRLLEEPFNKPLQWLVCQLHANELPLRHLLQELDGVTSGPRSFSGLIGQAMSLCENMPVVSYSQIIVELPKHVATDLSTDQQYLYEMCDAVSTGVCSESLSRRDPGTLSHSRWLTAANRILRLYVATADPSAQLMTLVMYIIRVYAPTWFDIKRKSSCKDGVKHLWNTISRSRYLSDELKSVVDPVIQRNGYFGHPENVLLGMLTDNRKHIRELAMRRILRARSERTTKIRQFNIPPFNFSATDYIDIIDWKQLAATEPPLTAHISKDELQMFVANREVPVIDFPKFPCYTQSVERCVKLVTEACAAVCGTDSRDGFIRVGIKSRTNMPKFDTKGQYRLAQ